MLVGGQPPHVRPRRKWNRKSRRTRKGDDASYAQDDAFDLNARLCTKHFIDVQRNPVPTAWSTVRAQPTIRLDRRSTPPSPVSFCVFGVFCGSIFLVLPHNLSNSLTPANPQRSPAARSVRPRRKWNRKSRRTRKGGDASQAQDNAFDLNARLCTKHSIDVLKKSGSQRVEHRQGAANDSVRQEINRPRPYPFACSACFAVPFSLYCPHNLSNSLTPANPQRSPAARSGRPRRK
jgi:hypothetical protein